MVDQWEGGGRPAATATAGWRAFDFALPRRAATTATSTATAARRGAGGRVDARGERRRARAFATRRGRDVATSSAAPARLLRDFLVVSFQLKLRFTNYRLSCYLGPLPPLSFGSYRPLALRRLCDGHILFRYIKLKDARPHENILEVPPRFAIRRVLFVVF